MLEIFKNNNKDNKILISNNSNKIDNNTIKNKKIVVSKKNKFNQKGNYILEETIGEGAFAKVKLAKHIITGEKVAIKILPKQNNVSNINTINNKNSNNISKIQKEINILRCLHHKNIIQLYEIIETKNHLYIVMEYCEGKELFDYIVKRKRLTEREACRYFQQIINGVEYLHLCKITHRDLKPENILLDNKKRIRISDFGLSGINTNYNSKLSTACGTPLYAPPEMLRGEKYDGVYSDIWSCGIILYTMLVGDLPYADSKEKIIYQNIMTHDYYYPETMSDNAVDLIEHMLKINPNERYGFKEIKAHPWFNIITPKLRPGIIHNIHKIPVDENILEKIEKMGYDHNLCKKSVLENIYDSYMALYLLTLKQSIRGGEESISDLFSDKYLQYINDYNNWIDQSKINNPLFYEYNIINIPNSYLSDENINSNLGIDNIDILFDSDQHLNIIDNYDNFSTDDNKNNSNIIKKQSDEIGESFNNKHNENKRLILRNTILKEKKDNSKDNDKSLDSLIFSSSMNIEEDNTTLINNNYNLTLNNSKKISLKTFKKRKNNNKIKKNKGLINFKTEMNKNLKCWDDKKNNLNKNLNDNKIMKKSIITNQNEPKGSPSKFNYKNIMNNNNNNISPILDIKNIILEDKKKINQTINNAESNNKNIIKISKDNNDLKITHKIEETDFLDKIFNDNLIDLESDSKLNLTSSGKLHDNNCDSKTFFSKDENNYFCINSEKNNAINIPKKGINRNINKLKAEKQKQINTILLTKSLNINMKNQLIREIKNDINKFDNDLKLIDDITKNQYIKYNNDINANENSNFFNMKDFANKLIKTTIFKNYLIRNNKKLKNEIEDKFYVLEKYKNSMILIEKLKNKIFVDKLSNFNFYTFDQYLNDEDDNIISSHLLKNKYLSSFIKKAKETLFNKSSMIYKRSYSKNYSLENNNNLLSNYINIKTSSKTPKCQLNNIIMNKTQNFFYKKYNNIYNTLDNSIKSSLLKRNKNTNKINSILFQDVFQNNIVQNKIYSHSIENKRNKTIENNNSKTKNKSFKKRLIFKNKYYLTENKFSITNNSNRNLNLDNNTDSSFNSIIIEEGIDENNNDYNKKLNFKKMITNNNKKVFGKRDNLININKSLNNKRKNINCEINNVNIRNFSDKKLIKINFEKTNYEKNFRNKTNEKRIQKKNDLSLTPDFSNSKRNKKKFFKHIINKGKIKSQKNINNKNDNNTINKQNAIKIESNKIKNKNELKELNANYPIDINNISLKSYDEIKSKIKKYFQKLKCMIKEIDNNIKIFKNGFGIEINFYELKDFEINNVYICFKFKGDRKNNLKFINDFIIYYLHI